MGFFARDLADRVVLCSLMPPSLFVGPLTGASPRVFFWGGGYILTWQRPEGSHVKTDEASWEDSPVSSPGTNVGTSVWMCESALMSGTSSWPDWLSASIFVREVTCSLSSWAGNSPLCLPAFYAHDCRLRPRRRCSLVWAAKTAPLPSAPAAQTNSYAGKREATLKQC